MTVGKWYGTISNNEEERSHQYCVMPYLINSDNMFDGTQFYETTEYMLGITVHPESWPGHDAVYYDNLVFKGAIGYSHRIFSGTIIRWIELHGKQYYACNGICEPERSTQILDIYKQAQAFYNGKQYITKYDIEKWMFNQIYKR